MTYYELNSVYGHDTFLLALNGIGAAVKVMKLCTLDSSRKTGPRSAVGSDSVCRYWDRESILARSQTLVEIDHEIISMDILLIPLIQEGLLSVTSESKCTQSWLTN